MCVFSQMKDIKHIRRDFHSVAWVMPQGSDLVVPWWVEWSNFFPKFNQIWSMAHATAQFFWGPGEGPKGQMSLNLIQRFLNQTLCVFSQLKDIKHIRWDFHSVAWVMPQGWDLGVPWGWGGVQKLFPQTQPVLLCELLT